MKSGSTSTDSLVGVSKEVQAEIRSWRQITQSLLAIQSILHRSTSFKEVFQLLPAIVTLPLTVWSPSWRQETFAPAKKALISRMEGRLQSAQEWLSVMRGISLSPPVWLQDSGPVGTAFNTVKDIAQVLSCLDQRC